MKPKRLRVSGSVRCEVTGKIRFSKAHVKRVCREKGLERFHCLSCGDWHTTHQSQRERRQAIAEGRSPSGDVA